MLEIVLALFTLVSAAAIVVYGTWLYRHRLRAGSAKGPAFREWLVNVTDALFGL
jgi:hypothetical protein